MADRRLHRKAGVSELLDLAEDRAREWRERHDAASLITGSADGWLVLDTLDALVVGYQAGLELYRAIQGGYDKCPMCKTLRLTHMVGCPVDDYMRALGMPNSKGYPTEDRSATNLDFEEGPDPEGGHQ